MREGSIASVRYAKMANLLSVTFCFLLATPASTLYFHISETSRKCFIEEIPDETMVMGKYKTQAFDDSIQDFLPSSPGIGMHVEIKDPNDRVILSKYYSAEGRFVFTSHTPGEHVICLHSNSTRWFGGRKLRVHLDIQVGEHANDYAQIAAKDKLSELQLRVRQLLDQVEQISKEQGYQRVSCWFRSVCQGRQIYRQTDRQHRFSVFLLIIN